jgi:hypothetical protein
MKLTDKKTQTVYAMELSDTEVQAMKETMGRILRENNSNYPSPNHPLDVIDRGRLSRWLRVLESI